MTPELLSTKLSMAMGAALVAAVAGLVARLKKQALSPDASYVFAALGLIVFFGESITGARQIDHTLAMWVYLAAAAMIAGAYLVSPPTFSLWSTLAPLLAMAYLFAPSTIWRWPLTLPLFALCIFSAISFARGEEARLDIDESFPGRLPLRRPPRIRGAREIALAVIASALAFVFGADLFWSAPPPAETPVVEEETAAPAATEPAGESGENKETPAEAPASYTARAGDTFKNIARRLYSDASKAREIARANPEMKPNVKLRAGQKIKLPSPAKQSDN